jgi:chromosome segregation ATPase
MKVGDMLPRGRTTVEQRLVRLEQLVEAQAERLQRQQGRLTRQRAALDEQARRLGYYTQQVVKAIDSATRVKSSFEILDSQVGALETRMADLADRVSAARLTVGEQDTAVARSLLDEIRTEHTRIRERFGVVAAFEERVRRLEDLARDDGERALNELDRAARKLSREFEAQDHPDSPEG